MNVKGNIPNTVFFSSFTDTPFLALTGTADETTERIISDSLGTKNHEKVLVSPNRINLRFSVKKIQKSLMFITT